MTLLGSLRCSHVYRKRGIYHYRRRLPGMWRTEVTVSLRTRSYREAEHLAAMLDVNFGEALQGAICKVETIQDSITGVNLNSILREHLKHLLDADLKNRLSRLPGEPIYADTSASRRGFGMMAQEADLQAIRHARARAERRLALGAPDAGVATMAHMLTLRHRLPGWAQQPLMIGLMEVNLRYCEAVERRRLGIDPLVFSSADPLSIPTVPAMVAEPPQPPSPDPLSTLIEPFLTHRENWQFSGMQPPAAGNFRPSKFVACWREIEWFHIRLPTY